MKHAGFTLVELLVAATLVLIVTAGMLAVAARGASGSGEQAAAVDIQQRLRAANEAIGANLLSAGAGPVNGVHGRPVGAVTASLLPFRTGARGDPAGTVRADALTILTARGSAASVALSVPWAPGALPATLSVLPGCPAGDLSCGVLPGDMVLLLDGRGQSDLFRVDAVTGSQLTLTPRGIVSGRAYRRARWWCRSQSFTTC